MSSPIFHRTEIQINDLRGQVVKEGVVPAATGGTATIWKGRWVENPQGEKLAIKITTPNPDIPNDKMRERLEKEMRIWRKLSHENTLKLYGWIEDSEQFGELPALVSPWCVHGNLGNLLRANNGKLDRLRRYSIIRDFTNGVHYMHTYPSGPIIHGDLKSANILIADGFVAKIADFGLSRGLRRYQADPTMTIVGPGTLRWMPPESLSRYTRGQELERPSSATDMWAWGHLVYETITGKIPYHQHANDFLAVSAIINGELNPRPTENEPNADMFLTALFWPAFERCWAFEPRNRPRITDIIRAGFFEDILPQNENPLGLRERPTDYGAARRYKKQGETAYRRGEFQQALHFYHKAREMFEGISDLFRQAECLRDLGWTNVPLRKYDDARADIMRAYDILVKIGDIKGQLGTMQDLAIIERAAGNSALARRLFQDAYLGCRDAGLPIRSGWCLVATALLDVDDQDWESAHNRFDAAVDIAVREGDQGLLGRSRERKGDCYMRQTSRAEARRCYDDAARAYRNLPGQEYQVERVEKKIQQCHNIRYTDINAMPLWNYRIMDDDTDSGSAPGSASNTVVH